MTVVATTTTAPKGRRIGLAGGHQPPLLPKGTGARRCGGAEGCAVLGVRVLAVAPKWEARPGCHGLQGGAEPVAGVARCAGPTRAPAAGASRVEPGQVPRQT